jgi:hypothetical protein
VDLNFHEDNSKSAAKNVEGAIIHHNADAVVSDRCFPQTLRHQDILPDIFRSAASRLLRNILLKTGAIKASCIK